MKGRFSLKKIPCLLALCLMLSLSTAPALAQASTDLAQDQIPLEQTQTEFDASLTVDPGQAYAGVELGVVCPEGVTVTQASSSSGSYSAGPSAARGAYWVSFFQSDNSLSGAMEITLHLSCTQAFEAGDLVVQELHVLTKDGAGVNTETQTPNLTIQLARQGVGASQSRQLGLWAAVLAVVCCVVVAAACIIYKKKASR